MDKEKFSNLDLQMFRKCDTFQRKLKETYLEELVTVEFCCCGFLKKVTGCFVDLGTDFMELIATPNSTDGMTIDIYPPGNGSVPSETAFRIVIPLDRVCAVESPDADLCPPPFCDEDE
ncbi:MAG: hypothetical protein ACOCRZ_03520 [Halothermotrichaceae bacterium]